MNRIRNDLEEAIEIKQQYQNWHKLWPLPEIGKLLLHAH